jgi:Polyketide cyclase / dehydrase and lipid transport
MRHRTILGLGLSLLLAAPPAPAAELGSRERERVSAGEILVRELSAASDERKSFEAFVEIPAHRSEVLRVLQDYERYPEFMPRVRRVDVLERSGEQAVLAYTLALPLGHQKRYRIAIEAEPGPGAQSLLRWNLVAWEGLAESETIRDTRGSWQLEPGSRGEASTFVTYRVSTDPGPIPLGLGWIVDWMSEKSLPAVLEKTRERVVRSRRG